MSYRLSSCWIHIQEPLRTLRRIAARPKRSREKSRRDPCGILLKRLLQARSAHPRTLRQRKVSASLSAIAYVLQTPDAKVVPAIPPVLSPPGCHRCCPLEDN